MSTNPKNRKPYTTGEVADLSHVTINAVKKWINAGKLKAFRTPGGHYRINREDFKDFVSEYRLQIKEEVFPDIKKILITDDVPEVLEFLKAALESREGHTYEIEVAVDGYEALIKVGEFKPDLLILDIRMPRIDGLEVCRRLRDNETTRDIKILAITAYAREEKENIIRAGADYCLPKPLGMVQLYEWVDKLLA
jgi:excisionase family DNA binding protein